jgi:signal transduction histidine kinase/ActR/RegA family two-component response regulator
MGFVPLADRLASGIIDALVPVALVLLGLSGAGALYTWLLHRALRGRTAELRRALERVRHAMALKDEFLIKVTHELRTPLHGLNGMHDALAGTALSEGQRKNLDLARSAAGRLDCLIGRLLDLSECEAGALYIASEEVDPARAAAEVVGRFTSGAEEKGLRIEMDLGGLPRRVTGDGRRLKQVIEALVDNAVRFTDEGSVQIRGRGEAPSGGLVELRFSVEDSGPGIGEEFNGVLFEPFRQADGSLQRRHDGSGLGLALAARLVEAMGGRLWLDSEPGQSARFCFTIRCGAAPEPVGRRPLRVLLAEDNALNQLVARRPLEKAGHIVVVAEDGQAAVARYELEPFDVVLMDVQMPVMDGLQATQAIRERELRLGRRVPIAAVTAHSLGSDRERYRAVGMDECLTKPFNGADLLALVERLSDAPMGAPVVH